MAAGITLVGSDGSSISLTPAAPVAFTLGGALVGPQGPTGATGPTGPTGPQGADIYSAPIADPPSNPVNGDLWWVTDDNNSGVAVNTLTLKAYPGLGVNYKNAQNNWLQDASDFNTWGVTGIRPQQWSPPPGWQQGIPNPASSSAYDIVAFWRLCAQTFNNLGFFTTWGIPTLNTFGSFGSLLLTSANWPQFHDYVVAEAAYLQSQNIILSEFELGNELEGFIDYSTITQSNLCDLLLQLAIDVKAVYSGKVGVAHSNYNGMWQTWVNKGTMGVIDYISIHPYGAINLGAQTVAPNTFLNIQPIIAAYPGKVYMSEFNIDASGTNILGLGATVAVAAMKNFLSTYIIGNVPMFMVYCYTERLNNIPSDLGYAMKLPNGTFSPLWATLFPSGIYQTVYAASDNVKRTDSISSSATPTFDTDNYDILEISALATNITSMTTNLTGTPYDGQPFIVKITDNGSSRTITWGSKFEASGTIGLPTTTTPGVLLTVGFMWNPVTSKWRIVGVS